MINGGYSMSSLERLIIQNINHNKLKESIYPSCDDETDIDRQRNDLIELYNLMLDKGYDQLPENTCEKRSYREIEAKLIELNTEGVKKSPIINSKGMPGEFITTQEKTMIPEASMPLSKMDINQLRDLAVSLGADRKKLYGTSKQSLIITIDQLKKKNKQG